MMTTSHSAPKRIFPVDALRGTIIVLMTLDHANHFIAHQHPTAEFWGGSFPVYTNLLPFLNRLLTHPAAPGFSFLLGVGMALFGHSRRMRGWSERQIIVHFVLRGTLLIAIQLAIVNRAWELFPAPWPKVYLGVLVALGGSMILGSLLLRLRPWALMLIALGLFVGMELIHPAPEQWGRISMDLPNLLMVRPGCSPTGICSYYPILPWLETVVFGIAFGGWLIQDPGAAWRRARWLGGAFLLAFLALRVMNGFGNIRPMPGDTWIDFLNTVKYPPSMTFSLMTMSVNLLLLGAFSAASEKGVRILRPLTVFGKAPLFVYVVHLFLYAYIGLVLTPDGSSLALMYLLWFLGLLMLYPLAILYGEFKARQPGNSLARLF
jgi:uncharacterized membrane protein